MWVVDNNDDEIYTYVLPERLQSAPTIETTLTPSDSVLVGNPITLTLTMDNLPTNPDDYGEIAYSLAVSRKVVSGGSITTHNVPACEGTGFPANTEDTVVTVPYTPAMAMQTLEAVISDQCPPGSDYEVQFSMESSQDFSDNSEPIIKIFELELPFEIYDGSPRATIGFSPKVPVFQGTAIDFTLTVVNLNLEHGGSDEYAIELLPDTTGIDVCKGTGFFAERSRWHTLAIFLAYSIDPYFHGDNLIVVSSRRQLRGETLSWNHCPWPTTDHQDPRGNVPFHDFDAPPHGNAHALPHGNAHGNAHGDSYSAPHGDLYRDPYFDRHRDRHSHANNPIHALGGAGQEPERRSHIGNACIIYLGPTGRRQYSGGLYR